MNIITNIFYNFTCNCKFNCNKLNYDDDIESQIKNLNQNFNPNNIQPSYSLIQHKSTLQTFIQQKPTIEISLLRILSMHQIINKPNKYIFSIDNQILCNNCKYKCTRNIYRYMDESYCSVYCRDIIINSNNKFNIN